MKNIFAVYKSKGPTSYDVIRQIKKITGEQRVGHAGTLDPLAAGVLVIGVGREATKKLGETVKKEKEYLAKIKLGATSATDDEEGEKKIIDVKKAPAAVEIKMAVENFIGEIQQTPPAYSAIKIKGRAAYKYARQGESPKLKSRQVEIKNIEILKYDWPFLELRVATGPGVYIRVLARDIGEKLKVGGYLVELERTRVGDLTKEDCLTVPEIEKTIKMRV